MRFHRREPLALVDGLLSDALGERYGPITARIVKHDVRERQAHLVDSKGVTRTWSVTFFSQPMPRPLQAVNAEIRAGSLIGETFRNHGFIIRKNVFDIFVVEVPRWLRRAFGTEERYAWARMFEFHARKRSSPPHLYATLCEIFTPDFKPPLVTPTDASWMGPSFPALLACGLTREQAWRGISRLEEGRDVNGRFIEARVATLPLAFALRRRVGELLGAK